MSCERNVFCEIVVNDYMYTSQEYVLSVSRGVTEPAFFYFHLNDSTHTVEGQSWLIIF